MDSGLVATGRAALRRSWGINAPLTLVGLSMLPVLAITLLGLALDPRVITGAPAWLKPAKFALSIGVYAFTLVWMLGFIRGRRRLVGFAAGVIAGTAAIEQGIIVVQAARGTTSHFNVGTPLDSALFATMGVAITILWTMTLLIAILLLAQRLDDPALAWALRLAILVALLGMAVAFLMTRPTPAQLTGAREGGRAAIVGAHSVGTADDEAGLPVIGWSTRGGDLRVPHFVGLHALQIIPLCAWLIARLGRAGGLRAGHRVALVWAAGLSYAGLVVLLTWQALRGQSLVAPDARTLAALAGLALAAALAVAATLLHARTIGTARAALGRSRVA